MKNIGFCIVFLAATLFCLTAPTFGADLAIKGGDGGKINDWDGKDGEVTDNDFGIKNEKSGGDGDPDGEIPGIGGKATYSSSLRIFAMDGLPATGANGPGAGGGGGAATWTTSEDTMSATYDHMRITGGDSQSGTGGGGGDALVAIWDYSVEISGNVYITAGTQNGLLPAGSALLYLDGGTLAVGGQIITKKDPQNLLSDAKFEMTDGTLEITSGYNGTNMWRNIFKNDGGNISISSDKAKTFVVHSGNYATLNVEVQGGGHFFKDGSGTLALGTSNKEMGPISVAGGSLQVGDQNGSGSIGVYDSETGRYVYDKQIAIGENSSLVFNGNSYAIENPFSLPIGNGGSLLFQNSTGGNLLERNLTLGNDASLAFQNTQGDNVVEGDIAFNNGAYLLFDTPTYVSNGVATPVLNSVNGLISGNGDVIVRGMGSKTVLTRDNTYTGHTIVGEGHELVLEGLIGAKGDNYGVYDGNIRNDGTLTFDKAAGGATRIQRLNGQMTGTGGLNQFADNRLVLTGANAIGGNVVIGRDNTSMAELEIAADGTFHAGGNLIVNANGRYVLSPENKEQDNFANLDTAISWTKTNSSRYETYASNTTFGGTAYFNGVSVWGVDISAIGDGDDPGLLEFAGLGFIDENGDLDTALANAALDAGNTGYFYSLEATNVNGAGYINVTKNNAVKVSDIYVNGLLLHHAGTIRTAVSDRVDHAMYRMSLESKKSGSCEPVKKHRLSGNSLWGNYVGRTNEIRTSYVDSAAKNFEFDSHGVQVGFDILATNRFVLGTVFDFEHHKGKLGAHREFTDRIKSDDFSIGLYGGYLFNNGFDIRGWFGFGTQDYTTQRYQALGVNPGVYHASTSGDTIEASFEIGRRFYCQNCNCKYNCHCELSFRPVVGFDYYTNRIGGARENRADLADVRKYGLSYDSMQLSQMSVRAGSDVQRYWKCFRFEAGAYYSCIMNGSGSRLSVRTTDGLHEADAIGSDLGYHRLTASFGGNYYLNAARNMSLFANYYGDYYMDRSGTPFGHNGVLGFQYRF